MKEVRAKAKENLKGFCRVCPVCNGKVCAGEVPGMGGTGTGKAFEANIEALAAVRLRMKTIHNAKDPSTSTSFLSYQLKTPIMAAPMTGTPYNMGPHMSEQEFIDAIVAGTLQAGSLPWTGDGADPAMFESGLSAIKDNQDAGIPIIKPRAQAEIIKLIEKAEAQGVVAVGCDVDGAGLITMALKNQPVGPKTPEELKEIIGATKLPFIIKGVMTIEEAELAVEVGAKAIVVSNHGGRVLDWTPGVAQVLPEIADRVKGKIGIIADGGIRTGADVLKLLALGAETVLVGRPLIVGAFGHGAEGVAKVIKQMTTELYQAMILTGCNSISEINRDILS